MFSRTKGIAALAVAFTLPLAACDDGTDAEFGTVSIMLTDAPGDMIEEAWVTITDIYFQPQDGDEDPDATRVYVLEDAAEPHELLSLANTVEDLVVDEEIPTGTYGQLRIVMSDGCLLMKDGSVYTSSEDYDLCNVEGVEAGRLQMPSYAQSGAKVLLNGLTISGGQQVLLLDFDVEDSFGHMAGNSGMWVMTPVIHASQIELTSAVEVSLRLDDDVTLPEGYELSDFSVKLTPPETDPSTEAFTNDDENDVFEAIFQFLLPSSEASVVELIVPEGLTVDVEPDSPVSVTPTSGQTVTVDWVIVAAEEAPTAG